MILRFKYGIVNKEHKYHDKQLEIIDTLLDENYIRNSLALSYKSCQSRKGRTPLDPVIGYKAHLLYFLKRDIVSFNELPKQIAKNDDYRAFCRCDGISFTSSYLSRFRKNHLNAETATQLHRYIFDDLEKDNELRIGIWDSVPMPSYSSPYKDTKHCDCQQPCHCSKSFSDKDATIGWQSDKPNRKDKFLGFCSSVSWRNDNRKHTAFTYDPDKDKRLPIATTAQPANCADIEIIEELLRLCKGRIDILLVDRAIYDFDQIVKWYLLYGILVIVRPKINAVLSEYSLSDTGTPCCPQTDEPLDWSYFDKEDNTHVYNCITRDCIYSHECQRQFEIPMSQHPALLGLFPAHTRTGKLLLSLRKLIEPEFGIQTLWSRLKSLPFRGLLNFRLLAQLMDTSHLLRKLVQGFG